MFIGYMRVSKSDGSQTLDLQRDALVAAGVEPARLYEDFASGLLPSVIKLAKTIGGKIGQGVM